MYGASTSFPLLSSTVELDNKGARAGVISCPTACHALLYDSDMRVLHHIMIQYIGCCICGPATLTFTIPLSARIAVFMCFVWISEHTAIFSLHNIKWLVFITETECVYCAVRTGFLTVIQLNFRF